jgi:Tat protein translocase TatB subunit
MFGTLGGPELFLIFVVALIVFGPRKLPEIGKSLGRMMSEFRRASNDFRSTIESEVEAEKIRDSMRIEPPKAKPTPAAAAAPAAGGEEASVPSSGDPASPAAADDTGASASPEPEAGTASPGGTDREPIPDTVSRESSSRPVEPQ